MENSKPPSKKMFWAGWIISGLCILFCLMDAVMKIDNAIPSVEASVKLGWPDGLVPVPGFILLACTILYAIPRTAFAGAVLITAYLGGATAIMLRADINGHPYFFPVVFGVVVWLGVYLRSAKLRAFVAG